MLDKLFPYVGRLGVATQSLITADFYIKASGIEGCNSICCCAYDYPNYYSE